MGGKLALGAVSVSAFVVIIVVHYQQTRDRKSMHEGVIRDMQSREQKRIAKTETR